MGKDWLTEEGLPKPALLNAIACFRSHLVGVDGTNTRSVREHIVDGQGGRSLLPDTGVEDGELRYTRIFQVRFASQSSNTELEFQVGRGHDREWLAGGEVPRDDRFTAFAAEWIKKDTLAWGTSLDNGRFTGVSELLFMFCTHTHTRTRTHTHTT